MHADFSPHLAQGGDALDEDEEDDEPAEEQAERELPHHGAHLVDADRHLQHLHALWGSKEEDEQELKPKKPDCIQKGGVG